jgi:hypothetical protein
VGARVPPYYLAACTERIDVPRGVHVKPAETLSRCVDLSTSREAPQGYPSVDASRQLGPRSVPLNSLDTEVEALKVQVLDREVVLLGPRVAVALSADAAAETARRLAAAAKLAANEPDRNSSSAGLLS